MQNAQKIFFTPGPSQLLPAVELEIPNAVKNGVCSISHRGKEFKEIFSNTKAQLSKLLGIPSGHKIFFLSSATEGMERIVQNTVGKNSFHFVNGGFSKKFLEVSDELGKNAGKKEVAPGLGFAQGDLSIPKDAELICFTHNETSTGVKTDFELIKQVKRENPDKLVAVDVVSSAPCVDIAFESADCVFFSVQKGFGLPAGLGVLVVSPQALEKTRQLAKNNTGATGSYHSFASLEKSGDRLETPETPNVLALHLLGVSCAELNKKGREKIICETKEKAKKLYSFFDGENKFKCFVKKENWRSDTIVVLNTPYGSAKVIADLNTKGFVVGTGYGGFKEKQVRLSNFPAHSMAQVDELIKAFE